MAIDAVSIWEEKLLAHYVGRRSVILVIIHLYLCVDSECSYKISVDRGFKYSLTISRFIDHWGIVHMNLKKTAGVVNGFIHDFAAGIWLAAIVIIAVLHNAHLKDTAVVGTLNNLERMFFWISVAAAVLIMATGAGRTFTYVDNWYGEDAEWSRRRALIVKHVILFSAYGFGYLWIWNKVFH